MVVLKPSTKDVAQDCWGFHNQLCAFWRSVDFKTKLSSHNFSQKTHQWICFFYPDDLEILTTWILISSFKYFWVVRIEKQIHLFIFGRSYGLTILFRELLTFSSCLEFEINKKGPTLLKTFLIVQIWKKKCKLHLTKVLES